METLKIHSLYAGYGPKKVLENINLNVRPGQFVSIVAPNGTGKSTLLKTIAGLLPILSGDIEIKGRRLSDYKRKELARLIAVVGTDVTAFDYTAEQMVFMGRFAHIPRFAGPTAEDHFIVHTAMEDVGIWHKRLCSCRKISQGEMQKIFIARALVQQPELLLLDEPTAHLDISNQYSILQLIKKIGRQKNLAVIAVLHDLNLAIQFSTHLLFLKDRQILDYGKPQDVLKPEVLKELYGIDFALHSDELSTYVRPIV